MKKPLEPVHVPGIRKGEEYALSGKEPGRSGAQPYRTSRDSTGINSNRRKPILPAMPEIPPA